MKEIKFRGYDEENKCWRYGWYTRLPEGARKYHAIVCDEDGTLVSYYIHNENTIGQFTGRHDKNGKEIYDGDIVRWFDVTGFGDGVGVVVWNNDYAGWVVVNDVTDVDDTIYNFEDYELEIIEKATGLPWAEVKDNKQALKDGE